jgi:hypothetical protein
MGPRSDRNPTAPTGPAAAAVTGHLPVRPRVLAKHYPG